MKEPIFILGCTKSGTTLMRNLFNGHQDLFVVPFESHFFQNISYWVEYYFRRTKPKNISLEKMKENLIDWVVYMNNITNNIADSFVENQLNIDRLRKYFNENEVNSVKEISDLYIKAIYYSINNQEYPENKRFVEKSVENVEFCNEWLELYPNAKFVHILRNPYSNIVAIRKYLAKKKKVFPNLMPAISSMKTSYYYLYKNSKSIKNYKIIRYEDLLIDPHVEMKNLCEYLNLDFNELLLTPTHLNKVWTGNSTNDKSFTKVSSDNINRWKDDITNLESLIVNKYFDFVVKDYNFESSKITSSVYWPQKNENIKNYVRNRAIINLIK